MAKQETMRDMLKGIYRDIDNGNTSGYGKNFISDLLKVRQDINNQIKLLKAAGVAYNDQLLMKILENVGVAKYF